MTKNLSQAKQRLFSITALANDYCVALQSTAEMDKEEFVASMVNLLPRIYWEFADFSPEGKAASDDDNAGSADDDAVDPDALVSLGEVEEYFPSYVDEDFYDSVRRGVECLLGPEDVFLETFEEDMKYSDTPIAASVSEGLADIFQALYDFTSIVKDSGGESIEGAYRECHADFEGYWSQTLVNVLRPLNRLRFNP